MINTRKWIHCWALALVTLLTGCSLSKPSRVAELPFRVAVLPVRVNYVRGDADADSVTAKSVLLELDAATLGQSLADELGRRVFADAVVVTPPARAADGAANGTAVVPASMPLGREDRGIDLHGVDNANLLLDCEVRIAPIVRTEINDRFWLNLVLWSMGGPFTWWVPDRTYYFEVRLVAALHEIEPIQRNQASLSADQARLAMAYAGVHEVSLALLDRAGWQILPYLGTAVMPAAWLATEGETVASRLREEAMVLIADELCLQIAELSEQIRFDNRVSDIGIEPGASVQRVGDVIKVRATALLRVRNAASLEQFTVRYGKHVARGEFSNPSADELRSNDDYKVLRYEIRAELPADANAIFAEIECVANDRQQSRRSFCIPLKW